MSTQRELQPKSRASTRPRYVEKKKLKEMARFIPFSLAATHMALERSGLEITEELKESAGVYIGVGIGGLEIIEDCTLTIKEKGPKRVSPYIIPAIIANMAAGQGLHQVWFPGSELLATRVPAPRAPTPWVKLFMPSKPVEPRS